MKMEHTRPVPHPRFYSNLESLMRDGHIPYSDGVILFGGLALCFANKKVILKSDGTALFKSDIA